MVIFFHISGSSSYYFHYLINLLLTSQIKEKHPGEKLHLFLPFLYLLPCVSHVLAFPPAIMESYTFFGLSSTPPFMH